MNPSNYTFETFIDTPANHLACCAAQKICETPGAYNPLYIFGPSGVGKTHLLHAIANTYKENQKAALYISANQFLEEMTEAIKTGNTSDFREKYYQADVLLIDNLQHFSGKEASQKVLLSIVEQRLLENKQVVFAENNSLERISGFKEELYAYLAGGVCLEIQALDLDVKAQIISEKLKNNGIEWPMDACRYVALNISSGVRQIEGEIHKILALKELF